LSPSGTAATVVRGWNSSACCLFSIPVNPPAARAPPRHTAGSSYAVMGASQKVIATLLGHSDNATIERYTHIARLRPSSSLSAGRGARQIIATSYQRSENPLRILRVDGLHGRGLTPASWADLPVVARELVQHQRCWTGAWRLLP
jgi:hypothetical protein